jgi:hypothetical protein
LEIELIFSCFKKDHVLYSKHAVFEMENEQFGRIIDLEVEEAVFSGEIIEEYPDDKPYPSILIFGKTKKNRPIHLVCAYNKEEENVVLIAVYHPDPVRWADFKKRIKQ